MNWKHATDHPTGTMNNWTSDVVAVTNFGNVFRLAYYNGSDGGVWQRPNAFDEGEQVEWWTEHPHNIVTEQHLGNS